MDLSPEPRAAYPRDMPASILVALLGAWVSAQEFAPPPPPPASSVAVDATVGDDALKVKIGDELVSKPRFSFTPSLTGGLLAPFGGGDGTLLPSPFGTLGAQLAYHGAIDSLVIVRGGLADLESHKLFSDPNGLAASPADARPAQSRFSQADGVISGYADAGKVFSLGPAWKAAVFAAADMFGMGPLTGGSSSTGQSLTEGSVGALVMRRSGANEFSVNGSLDVETADRTMWRNGDSTLVPGGEIGAEYARDTTAGRAAVGVDTTLQRADFGIRPYLKLETGKLSMMLAAEARRSRDAFYPDSNGAAAAVSYAPVDGLRVGVQAKVARLQYPMAPAPVMDTEVMANLSIDVGRVFHSDTYRRLTSRTPAARYVPAYSDAINARMPDAADQARFASALAASPTLEDFAKNYGLRSIDDVLAAASMLTSTLSSDYNYNEGHPPNVAGADNLYAAMRRDYLAGKTDPLTVCIGAAQLAADMARAANIPLEASAMTVQVPGAGKPSEGHAVAAIKTQQYGIVFVDWGRLTPTYTWDTKQALAIYQGLQGVPSLFHEVTAGTDGSHVGYLFTEDGKKIVRGMSALGDLPASDLQRLFDDDPRGGPMTIERFRELTRGKFVQ